MQSVVDAHKKTPILKSILLGALYLSSVANAIWVPDCSKPKHKDKPACLCRYPNNWKLDICQGLNWWGKPEFEKNLERNGRIVVGENTNTDEYPWFAPALAFRGGTWAGCRGMWFLSRTSTMNTFIVWKFIFSSLLLSN
jgi:hypothetical protein